MVKRVLNSIDQNIIRESVRKNKFRIGAAREAALLEEEWEGTTLPILVIKMGKFYGCLKKESYGFESKES
ncbi:hypothetical protein HYT84_00470 [Candidatus Micrarchaeota archaeon]|nr:hypothetical protein [Candidatus Micrarchaeota archaeon]